jgi:putative nucleotidyltransferase with HDIG domain
MEMMEHIVVHSLQVCSVAVFLADSLAENKPGLNRDLVQASSLLHDITKTRSITTKEDHAETGAELIHELGYPEVASIIGQHVRLNDYAVSGPLREAEIVNYADKRVLHDRVVSIKERMDDIQNRYARTKEQKQRVAWFWEKIKRLETKIFIRLAFAPEDLQNLMEREGDLPDLSTYYRVCGGM